MLKELFNDILKELGVKNLQRPNILKCPNCGNEMKKISIKSKGLVGFDFLTLDYCQNCESIWFDRGELIKALEIELEDISKFFPSKTKQSIKGSGKRICPICQKNMTLINYSKDSNIWVDICSNGCGIFLDAGELELLKLYSLGYDLNKNLQQVSTQTISIPPAQQAPSLLQEIKSISNEVATIIKNTSEKVRTIEKTIKDRDINKMKQFLKQDIFSDELQQIGLIKQRIKDLYHKYGNLKEYQLGNLKELDKIEASLEGIINFINSKSTTLEKQILSEIELLETVKKVEDKTIILPSLPSTVESKTLSLSGSQNVKEETKEEKEEKEVKKEQNLFSTELLKQSKTDKISPVLTKQRLSGFENLYGYLFINNDLFIFSENKIFLYKENNFEELKIPQLNFRIKKIKQIGHRLFIIGSSGNLMELTVNWEYKNSYRFGYSDIIDILQISDMFLAITTNKVYFLDDSLKIVKEKNLNNNFLEFFEGQIIGGTNNLLIYDKDLNKIQEYQTGSFQYIKKVKQLGKVLFLLGSGLLAKFENQSITKLNLPKSYLEVNDIAFISEKYYLACNNGGFYQTTNFIDYQEIKLDSFDNIYCIIIHEKIEKIILTCSSSNVIFVDGLMKTN